MNVKMKFDRGLTLIELMIVISVITIIVTISLPGLIQARKVSNESTAQSNLHTIVSAQTTYYVAEGRYADKFIYLVGAEPPFLDQSWSEDVSKNGYIYALEGEDPYQDFSLTATRISAYSGSRSFFVDSSGVIRYVMGDGPADAESTQIGQVDSD